MTHLSPLSRVQIATAALALLDEEGPERFSVRRVADRLGRGVMSLYRHVADRDDLVLGVAELLFDEPISSASSLDAWPDRVRAAAKTTRQIAREHGGAVFTIMASLPSDYLLRRTVEAMRLADSPLEPGQQRLVMQAVVPFLSGWCLAEAQQAEAPTYGRLEQFDEVLDVILLGLQLRFSTEATGRRREVDR